MKCRWSHCKHGGEVSKEEAVHVGNMYYHKDCFQEKSNIDQIIELYKARVDPDPIIPALRKVINDLIFKKGFDSGYVLYALQYCMDNGWNLRYPAGMYYVVKNDSAKAAWDNKKRIASKKEFQREQADILNEKPTGMLDLEVDNLAPTNKPRSGTNRFSSILR